MKIMKKEAEKCNSKDRLIILEINLEFFITYWKFNS